MVAGAGTVRPAVSRNWKLILVGESVYRSGFFLSPDCPERTGLPRPFLVADFCFLHLHTNTVTSTTVRISTIAASTPTSQLSFSSEKERREQFSIFKYKERLNMITISSQTMLNIELSQGNKIN